MSKANEIDILCVGEALIDLIGKQRENPFRKQSIINAIWEGVQPMLP